MLKIMQTLLDVFSISRHSRYFNQTRSHHVFQRVRLISLLLAVLQTAWVLIDQLLLPVDVLPSIAAARIASSVALVLLLLWYRRPYHLGFSLARLGLLILILSAFQTFSQVVLLQAGYEQAVAGYQFFPFMIVAMQAIFPLTIVEVVAITAAVTLVELMTQLWAGQFGTVAQLNELWLLLVLAVIAGWASVNQLDMLLGLYRQATRDTLTGLANRRKVMEHLEGDVEMCREQQLPLSVLLFDLDKFKGFNDNHGHAAGDIVLKQFAKILRQQTKPKGKAGPEWLAGRFGGEEFLAILPAADAEMAATIAGGIIAACHLSPVRIPSGEQVGFTTSIGIATLAAGETTSDLLGRVDAALYQAKANGRDRYVVAKDVADDRAPVHAGEANSQAGSVGSD